MSPPNLEINNTSLYPHRPRLVMWTRLVVALLSRQAIDLRPCWSPMTLHTSGRRGITVDSVEASHCMLITTERLGYPYWPYRLLCLVVM